MFGTVRTSILAAGIFALGLALLFASRSESILPLFSFSGSFSDTYRAPTSSFTDSSTYIDESYTQQGKKTKDSSQTEKVLGTSPENLQVAQEERTLVEEPIVSSVSSPPSTARLSAHTLYEIAALRVVNLFCELPGDEVAIATGVLIHSKGYILTNAHVANAAEPRSCLIRRGSPARNFAIAERIFLPPGFSSLSHTRENLSHDVAIWKISSVLDTGETVEFPSLAIRPANLPADGTILATFSYPAELLGSHAVVSALYLSFSETHVVSHDAYFIESTQGLGSQKGSSGGILLDPFTGEFAGLIFAINDKKTEYISERTLFSLTPFAINETIRLATGKDLDAYLADLP